MKKGFTLIELLAVIVILAIIALIASPIVVGLIEDSNKQAAERSTEAVIKAAKTQYALSQMNDEYDEPTTYTDLDLDNPPTGGTVSFDANGDVVLTGVKFGNYTCAYTKAAGVTCTKNP
ncbi:MAG: prepilin-type N-terminal cleavage/methylation domain-containing protein [Bacilli bacterium]|nr:prepilin-type N-terminal cleavage/methylation domain-containing protein [Bacilli bacterium]MDD4734059.1 prepilin-type N-terminal cleavage/methylation domain-containing protein [Bacilli bacterium]